MPVWVGLRVRRARASEEAEVGAKVNRGFIIEPCLLVKLPRRIAESLH